MNMKKLCIVMLSWALVATAASAATISVEGGAATATVQLTGDLSTILGIDIRSSAILGVNDPLLIGLVPTTDAVNPYPNSLLLSSNAGATELMALLFSSPVLAPDLSTINFSATTLALTPITDPALGILSTSALNFSFAFNQVLGGNVDQGFVIEYTLTGGTAVPEPGTATTVSASLGILPLAAIRWRRRRRFAA